MSSMIIIGIVGLLVVVVLGVSIWYLTSKKDDSGSPAPSAGSPSSGSPSSGSPSSGSPSSGSPGPAPAPSVPQGMITGKIVKVARADNRPEFVNLLGIDVFDKSGARITSGITPTISPAVYANDPSHFGPQFLIDGVHQENGPSGLRLPHSTNVPNAYHQLDLGKDTVISKIIIYNRTACCSDRINGCNLTVNNAAGTNVLTIPLSGSKAVYTFGTPLANSSTSSTYVPEPYDDMKETAGY